MKTLISPALAVLGLMFGPAGAWAQSSVCTSPLSDIYYTKYTVVEAAIYLETNAAGPVLAESNGFFFTATVNLKTNYSATDATVAAPGQSLQPMKTSNNRVFTLLAQAASYSNLTAAYPGGDYTFVVSNDVTTVNLPDGAVLPNAPSLSSFAGAQSIDPNQDYTLSWNSFAGGQAKDYIGVSIAGNDGTVFQSPDDGCAGALDGTVTSVVIPAYTLAPNQTYRADIVFINILTLDTNSTPDVALLAGTEAETEATLSTAAATAPVLLTNAAPLPGNAIRFDVTTVPGLTYTIQFTSSLGNPAAWTSLLTTNAVGSLLSFTNTPAAGFYRAFHN